MKLRTWLQGAGGAALVLFPFYRSFLDMPGILRMHTPISLTTLALSLITNLLLVSLVFLLLGVWLRDWSGWALLRLFVPALVLASLFEVVQIARTGWISTVLWVFALLVVLLFTLVLHRLWHQGESLPFHLSAAILMGLGFFCIIAISQLAHLAMWHQQLNYTCKATTETANSVEQPRVVWILFDELSYEQGFGDRYPNLELPNFDELRKSSTLFTDVQPIINDTEKAVPSMLLGQNITRVNYVSGNRLDVGGPTGPLYQFNAVETPFALARHLGLTTGVVGWYNPYCGILIPYLDQCYWTFELQESGGSVQENFWEDFSRPWISVGMVVRHPVKMLSRSYRAQIIADVMTSATAKRIFDPSTRLPIYKDLMQHAYRILRPSGPDFVFLHLSVPHPPGFYNRRTQQFDTSGQSSYIDNLALADKALGQLLTVLQQSPRWKNTSVVVCGDHSWRVYTWSIYNYWTPEDEAASHGRIFDPRPMLMVHLAGQTTPATVNEPFPLLKVHDILDDLVQGKQPTFPQASH